MAFALFKSFLSRRILVPVRNLLTQGVTPEKISLSLALGMTLSICPLLGLPTILCTLAAVALRLNLGLLQGVNYLGTAPQWALIIPFLRMGEHLFGAPPLPISVEQLRASFASEFWETTFWFWKSAGYATLAWLLMAPFVFGILYVSLLPTVQRAARARIRRKQQPVPESGR